MVIETLGRLAHRMFDELITSDQPKAAFAKWWEVQNAYGYFVELGLKQRDQRKEGANVVMTYDVQFASEGRFMPGDRMFHVSKSAETWSITLTEVLFGGWKVSRIDVLDPVGISDRGVMP
ncbi:hypothetical protein AB0B66_34360 [Catellatospora sp. NPDC049111]|uniref:hypothetical protein n=1 Tax=Catellatospora sp. NPDC049111 TaxID=3155271 RepID=UPI0033C1A7E6